MLLLLQLLRLGLCMRELLAALQLKIRGTPHRHLNAQPAAAELALAQVRPLHRYG